jgi:hypothetical protein
MQQFEPKLISAMRTVFDEVCRHIPSNSTSARTFVVARILECASSGPRGASSGRSARGFDHFGSIDAIR